MSGSGRGRTRNRRESEIACVFHIYYKSIILCVTCRTKKANPILDWEGRTYYMYIHGFVSFRCHCVHPIVSFPFVATAVALVVVSRIVVPVAEASGVSWGIGPPCRREGLPQAPEYPLESPSNLLLSVTKLLRMFCSLGLGLGLELVLMGHPSH